MLVYQIVDLTISPQHDEHMRPRAVQVAPIGINYAKAAVLIMPRVCLCLEFCTASMLTS